MTDQKDQLRVQPEDFRAGLPCVGRIQHTLFGAPKVVLAQGQQDQAGGPPGGIVFVPDPGVPKQDVEAEEEGLRECLPRWGVRVCPRQAHMTDIFGEALQWIDQLLERPEGQRVMGHPVTGQATEGSR